MHENNPLPLPSVNLLPNSGHWNDLYMTTHVAEFPFREDINPTDVLTDVEHHYEKVWEQQQTLLELACARIEKRQSPVDENWLSNVALSKKILSSDYLLARELYLRMGPHNEMQRSDMLLTELAGLVADEVQGVAERDIKDDASKPDPFIKAVRSISALTEMVRKVPGTVHHKEPELLLIAELLSEAHRTPDPMREKSEKHSAFTGEQFDKVFYCASVIEICDSLIINSAEVDIPLPEKPSKPMRERRKDMLGVLASAVQTKYDILFDNIRDDTPVATSEKLVAEFALETADVMDKLQFGFAYELFAQLAYRYVAFTEGNLDQARVWQATLRSDVPRDMFGFKPGSGAPAQLLAGQYLKKQSSDMVTGLVRGGRDNRSAKISQRYQLKGRSDADYFTSEYDSNFVSIHSADGAWLIKEAELRLNAEDSGFATLDPKERFTLIDQFAKQALIELSHMMIQHLNSKSDIIAVRQIDNSNNGLHVDSILNEVVVPVYRQMQTAQGLRSEAQDLAKI